jgi:transcription antitermination factor NusG
MQEVQSPERTPFSEIKHRMEADKETEIWYAMRATYRREPDAMRLLEKEKLGCFVPMQYKISMKKGKKIRSLVPVIHNLLFVHACPSDLKRVKSQVTYLQYITDTRSGQKIIVPDKDMQRFIAVSGTYNDHLLYFQPDELNLSKGTKVRVIGGEFEGQEGVFLKVRGARDRRVVIQIQGVIAVAMATIHPDLIEVIE